MAQAPRYDIGDTVYIRESAAMGFLEVLKIQSIHWLPCRPIQYKMCQSFAGPNTNTTFGERITHKKLTSVLIAEDGLITHAEAVCLVRASLQIQVNLMDSLLPEEGTCDD